MTDGECQPRQRASPCLCAHLGKTALMNSLVTSACNYSSCHHHPPPSLPPWWGVEWGCCRCELGWYLRKKLLFSGGGAVVVAARAVSRLAFASPAFLQRRAPCSAAATASTTKAPACVTAAGKDPSVMSPSRSASTLFAAATARAPTATVCAPSATKGRAVERVRKCSTPG